MNTTQEWIDKAYHELCKAYVNGDAVDIVTTVKLMLQEAFRSASNETKEAVDTNAS